MKNLQKIQCICFKKEDRENKYLLLKRELKNGKHIWQGMSGGVDDTDPSLKDAVVREVGEELGLRLVEKQVMGPFLEFIFVTNRKGYEGQTATETCFAVETEPDFQPILSEEHSEYHWLPYVEAVNLIDFKESKLLISLIEHQYGK